MPNQRKNRSMAQRIVIALCILAGGRECLANEKPRLDFSRDIRPILSDKCFRCHGPDGSKREADLRLDIPEGAYADLGVRVAIKPKDPGTSLVVQRIQSTDESERMPPIDSGLSLNKSEIDLIVRWIEQGAVYDSHWAFRPIQQPALPDVHNRSSLQTFIDGFIQAKLAQVGLTGSSDASRETRIRRLYLDLLGLPPRPEEVRAFVDDGSLDAFERLTDRALANPHYGERWGRHWLDQARYADTNGYSVDSERSIWPYREWVIAAWNRDVSFDQFTIEQLAGDLLPNPTREQLIATGFHRNTLINQEGGTDAEQFRVEAVVDRINTTGAVWLGLTVGCAQCHTHKYDPLSHREYYQLFAFFNSGQDVNSVTPTIQIKTDQEENRLADLDRQIATAKAALVEYDRRKSQTPSDGNGDEKKAVESTNVAIPDPERETLVAGVKKFEAERASFEKSILTTMVMRDLKQPRQTHILIRGDFLRKGDAVEVGVPQFLPALSESSQPPTRLDLANWLVSGQNPLVARVTVNRAWMHFFSEGLVETENDFGMQGTLPTHPELLDWLSAEFMRQGWSFKRLHRQIVTSQVYLQSSEAHAKAAALDPRNKLLARQNRVRVEAEIVRDLALSASGLLESRIGGRSVYPPQPDGVYAFTQRAASWPTSQSADRFRRGLYTFFMRSAPYPMLSTFDTPRLDATCTRRMRSNTPLQSLTMANDQAMIEIAQALGKRLVNEVSTDDALRLNRAYQLCLARNLEPFEQERLLTFVEQSRADFQAAVADAEKVAGSGWPTGVAPSEAATWTCVARVVLNLDEFITRE